MKRSGHVTSTGDLGVVKNSCVGETRKALHHRNTQHGHRITVWGGVGGWELPL